jgi:hypothetical protein
MSQFLTATLLVLLLTSAATAEDARRVVLGKIDTYRVMDPMFEGVRIILSYRGEKYSPAYIQGISGSAFRIGGPCPCAPTCECATDPAGLVRLFGYQCDEVKFPEGKDEARKRMDEIVARTKLELRANRPALLWHAFTYYEWDVVCGYDEDRKQFCGRGSYTPHQKALAWEPQDRQMGNAEVRLGAIFIGAKTGTFEARAAELGALREAVLHAHGASASSKMPVGLACYDAWIGQYRDLAPGVKPAMFPGGSGYMLGILCTTRRAAADFMRELAPRYPEAKVHLEMAAEAFSAEATALVKCAALPADKDKDKPNPDTGQRAAAYLSQARAMYALGIDEIARALKAIKNP